MHALKALVVEAETRKAEAQAETKRVIEEAENEAIRLAEEAEAKANKDRSSLGPWRECPIPPIKLVSFSSPSTHPPKLRTPALVL